MKFKNNIIISIAIVLFSPLTILSSSKDVTIAVLPFEVNGIEADKLIYGYGFSDLILNDMMDISGLRIVERTRLSSIIQELKLEQTGLIEINNATKTGKLLEAEMIVIGSIQKVKNYIQAHIRIVKISTGEIMITVTQKRKVKNFNDFLKFENEVSQELVKKIRSQINISTKSHIKKRLTNSLSAFENYSQGLNNLYSGKYEQAIKSLDRAYKMDTRFKGALSLRERVERAFEELHKKVKEYEKNK